MKHLPIKIKIPQDNDDSCRRNDSPKGNSNNPEGFSKIIKGIILPIEKGVSCRNLIQRCNFSTGN